MPAAFGLQNAQTRSKARREVCPPASAQALRRLDPPLAFLDDLLYELSCTTRHGKAGRTVVTAPAELSAVQARRR